MGGLRQKMPITFWTFVIGGFALSGFPLVTAGFWSKDEILADAWHQGSGGDTLALLVFITLALAALLTAFYTMRQIAMTFLGRPRTSLAEHARESNWFMTVPLIGLAIFALGAGWAGIPDNFLGTDGIFTNYYHGFVGTTVEEALIELEEAHIVGHALEVLEFNPIPLATSVLVAIGGLFLGWWVYGRRPMEEGQSDPLIKPMGPLHTFLHNKWYWDELYSVVFVEPTKSFSRRVVYEWGDKGIIDGTLHLIARTVFALGQYLLRFENAVIKGWVDWAKDQVLAAAQEFRAIQTGKIQEYILVSVLIGWALAVVVLLINSGLLDGLLS